MDRLAEQKVLPLSVKSCTSQIIGDIGGILGSVRLEGVLHRDGKSWFGDNGKAQEISPWAISSFSYLWVFSDPEPFDQIFRCKGFPSVWYLKNELNPEMPEPKDPEPQRPKDFELPGSH